MADSIPELELPSGERVPVAGALVLGRSNEADVVIADPEASRRHAQVRPEAGGYLLVDLESRNGTALNGELVAEPRPLREGDVIQIGRTALVFRAPVAPTLPADTPQHTIVVEATMQMPSVALSPMQVLGRISRQVAGIVDAKALADTVTTAIKDEYGCEGASLILLDEEAGELYFASVASSEAASLKLMTLRREQGIAGEVVESREPRLVRDVARHPNHAVELDRALGFSSRSIVAAPVIAPSGEILGALEAVNPLRKPAFDDDDLEFIGLVAAQLGVALVNARSWDAIKREREALSRVAGIRQQFIARSPEMVRLILDVSALHSARAPIYLAGEPGTGRRTLARLTHESSGDDGALVEIDGAAPPAGWRESAATAPVHWTNLDHTPLALQEELATVISTLAGSRPVYVSGASSLVSLISAGKLSPTLHAALEAGQRLLPPLRARADELEPLIEHFVGEVSNRLKRDRFTFSPDAVAMLREYPWPGNVAELGGLVRRVGILGRDPVVEVATLVELAPELARPAAGTPGQALPGAIDRKRTARLSLAAEHLEHGDATLRREAVATVAAIPGDASNELLCRFLSAPEPAVRVRAAAVLGSRSIGGEALAAALAIESDPGVSVAFLDALAESGLAADYEVTRLSLGAADPAVRRAALRALRRTAGNDAREPARQALGDSDPAVVAEAMAALYQLGDADAAVALAAMTHEPAAEAATAAIDLCGELAIAGDDLLALVSAEDAVIRVAAVRALGRSGDQRYVEPLLEQVYDPVIRVEVIESLGRLGSASAAPALVAAARDAAAPVVSRRSALVALARTADPSALPVISALLADPELADAAIEGLATLAVSGAEAPLLELLSASPDRAGAVAPILAAVGTSEAIGPLLSAAARASQHDLAVLEALVALAERLPDRPAVIAAVATACEDETLRLLGLQLLAELRDPRATPVFLAYRDWSQEARAGLERLGAAATPELLAALDGPDRAAAEETLAELGQVAVAELLPLLGSPNAGRTAARVIQAAGELALPALLDAAERRDPETLPLVLQLIGRTGPSRMASYVATFLESAFEPVRYAAIVALGDLPDTRSEEELLRLMEAADTVTAGLATLALGRIQSARAFDAILARTGPGDRKLQYANAAAIANYNLRQPPVLALVHRMVREGLPFTLPALQAGIRAGALEPSDILDALADPAIAASQKRRLLSALGKLPSELAVPALAGILRDGVPAPLLPAVVAALVRHEAAAVDEILALVREPGTRQAGLEVLEAMQDPEALLAVLRRLSAFLPGDPSLHESLRAMGHQVLGPLLDVLYDHWDLETLGLLWQLSQVATEPAAQTAAV